MPSIHSYADADTFLYTRGKPVPRKKVANHTYLVRDDHKIHVLLHRTYVLTYTPDTIVINTGGWLTVTTKARINDCLPRGYVVYSDKGTWYLSEGWMHTSVRHWRYTDGITMLERNGSWHPVESTMLPDEKGHQDDRHNAAMRKLIGQYLKDFERIDAERQARLTTQGTCTLCRGAEWPVVNGRSRIITYGDQMDDTQHLIDHMLDRYLPDGLVPAALTEKGYLEHPNHGVATIKRALRSYLSSRLFVGATAPVHGRHPNVLQEAAA